MAIEHIAIDADLDRLAVHLPAPALHQDRDAARVIVAQRPVELVDLQDAGRQFRVDVASPDTQSHADVEFNRAGIRQFGIEILKLRRWIIRRLRRPRGLVQPFQILDGLVVALAFGSQLLHHRHGQTPLTKPMRLAIFEERGFGDPSP